MAASIPYNGDDLLKVFKSLNIELGSLNSNVIRAWFDTEDEDTLNLLDFMCSSLSNKNVSIPQELQEFEALKEPLHDMELENATNRLEVDYPCIFDYELNSQLTKIYEQQLEYLEQEEQILDNSIKTNENLQQNLLGKKFSLEEISTKLDFNCEEASKKCEELSQILDNKNLSLHKKLMKDISYLSNFLFSKTSDFLNQMNLEDIEDSDEFCASIQEVVRKQHEDLSGNFSESKVVLNSTPYEDNLEILRSRIYSSYMEYLNVKIEEGSLVEALKYLENFFAEDYLANCNKTIFSDEIFSSKVGQKKMLFELLEKKAVYLTEEPINYIQIKKSQNDLKSIQDNLLCFSQISEYYTKVLCITSSALMLFHQEKKSVENFSRFLSYTSRYILNTLNDLKIRNDMMEDTIKKFKDFIRKPIESRNQNVKSIMDIHQCNTLKEAFLSSNQLQNKLGTLEQNFFENNSELSGIVHELLRNDTITQFLYSGPTSRALIIPSNIQTSLKNIRLNLDKQTSAVKFSVQITTDSIKRLRIDNWLKNSRLVWAYFLTSPEKLQDLFKQVFDEIKAKEARTVRFKE